MTRPPSPHGLPAFASVALLALGSVACSKPYKAFTPYAPHPCTRPDLSGCLVRDVSVVGNQQVPATAIKDNIATAETNHSLGGVLENIPILSVWDRITVDYEKFDPFVLERDMARVERLYRARGFYEAHARVARVQKTPKGRVDVTIVVDEGAPVVVGDVTIDWASGERPAEKGQKAADKAAGLLEAGKPFAEDIFEDTKKKVARALTDNGYAYAKVEAKAEVDLVTHQADVTYQADLGPAATFGPITIEGAGDLPLERIRSVIKVKEGDPFSTAKLDSAQLALSDLRVFGSVDALPQVTAADKPRSERITKVPVIFQVTPTALKTAKGGLGAEVGSRVDVHGVAGWENRNFLGGLRSFTIEAKPGIVFFPFTLVSLFSGSTDTAVKLVPELKVHSALTQPGFIESRTRGTISADFNMYQLQPTDTLGYLELAAKTGVDRDWWDGRVHGGITANVQFDQPLTLELPGIRSEPCGGGYHFLVIPYIQTTGSIDLRRNADGKRDSINPHSGFYLNNNLQLAVGAGSTDVRVRPDVRAYVPIAKRVTLALRVVGGLLHSFSGDLAKTPDPKDPPAYNPTAYSDQDISALIAGNCKKTAEPAGMIARSSYIQILQLRGFNSGGTNSNRGYAFSGIGPQEQVLGISALTPAGTATQPDPRTGKPTVVPLGVPLPIATGGKALWEASIELRFPLYQSIGATIFLDGSDVRDSLADFGAPFAPHLSTGLGIRYATPVGPLRVDLGLRIPGAQVIGNKCAVFDPAWSTTKTPPQGCFLPLTYGQAGSIGGVPLALSLAIGEAY